MAGKVRRSRQYADYLKKLMGDASRQGGAEYLIDWDKLPLTEKEEQAFSRGVAQGLLNRIRRKCPKDSALIEEILLHCAQSFQLDALKHGIPESGTRVAQKLAYWTSRDIEKLRKPTPGRLLEESANFERQLPSKRSMDKRRQFILDRGLRNNLSLESDAELTEAFLADKFRISTSEVHKLLARAVRSVNS